MQLANMGVHHVAVGNAVVTALNDLQFEADAAWITGLPVAEAEALLREGFRVLPPRITVSCFLVRMDGRTVLVDTGAGAAMGHHRGLMLARLLETGVAPEDVETLLITHAHVDHIGGLLNADGGAMFANADLVIHAAEAGFWLNRETEAKAPEGQRPSFGLVRRSLAPYASRTRLVQDGEEAAPGITAVHLPGHTPGHTGWRIASAGAALLIWGDIVHLPGLQFARPEAGLAFDIDGDLGRATRARTLDMVATERLLLAGMHLDFPTFGHVRRAGAGYAFEPLVWAPTDTGMYDPG